MTLARFIDWFFSSPPAVTITSLGVLVSALRWKSNREHKATQKSLDGISVQLNGQLLERITRIERKLGIFEADQ